MYKMITVIGNRPQFVKQAVLDKYLRTTPTPLFECITVNTGQHYDSAMSDIFFQALNVKTPKYNLGIGSGPIADQIGKMLAPLREIYETEKPDVVLLFGDTNSTVAGALVAAHAGIPCVHVEGGERLYRRFDVPEEINRVATDHLSDLLLTSSRKAMHYLHREGFSPERAKFAGDIMLDLFVQNMGLMKEKTTLCPADFGVKDNSYILATLHRVENTNSKEVLLGLLEAMDDAPLPVLLPMHPRISGLIEKWGWAPSKSLKLIDPVGYFEFLRLLDTAALVVSDSGGVTREALFAHKGCIVPLNNCWWTEAVEAGFAVTVGQDAQKLRDCLHTFRPTGDVAGVVEHNFGTGTSAKDIITQTAHMLNERHRTGQKEGDWHKFGSFDQLPSGAPRTEFSYTAFLQMLNALKSADYTFTSYQTILSAPPKAPYCLMRHDIDFSLEKALEMAQLETSVGVQATYFFMISSENYNVFSKQGRDIVQKILALGHNLGLHFDAAAYDNLHDAKAYQKAVATEAAALLACLGTPITAVSFHRPSPLILEGSPDLTAPYVHTYDQRLRTSAEYVADSGGDWKFGPPLERDAFHNRTPLQILIHPVWWSHYPTFAFETLLRLQDEQDDQRDVYFAQNCKTFRIGHLESIQNEQEAKT